MFRHQLLDHSKIINGWSRAVTVLQRKASMQQIGLPISQQLKEICILTHCNYSQPASIKLDNENIGGHCYTFTAITLTGSSIRISDSLQISGVTLDSIHSLDPHINNVVKNCNYHLQALRHIRLSITKEVATKVGNLSFFSPQSRLKP